MESVFAAIQKRLEGVPHQLTEHAPVFTSEEASATRGVPLEWGVKAMVLKTPQRFVLVLVRADKKVDLKLIKTLESTSKIRLATPQEVLEQTQCEIGSVPPFGFGPLKTYADREIFLQEHVTFNAGLHHKSVQMSGQDLKRVLQEHIEF